LTVYCPFPSLGSQHPLCVSPVRGTARRRTRQDALRRHRDGRRPRRDRGGPGGRGHGRRHAPPPPEHRDLVQMSRNPAIGGIGKGHLRQGDRRARRAHGPGRGPRRDPVPALERPGAADARADGSGTLQVGRAPGPGGPGRARHLSSGGRAHREIQARYSVYIDRQEQKIAKNRAHEDTPLAADLDYVSVRCLSTEVVQKLSSFRLVTFGQAARISAVTPAALSLLRVHLKRRSAV
jgi:tRNA modification enzyme MnmG/GidA-like protein